MKIKNPLPRTKYKKYLIGLKGKCVFCEKKPNLLIKNFKNWTWTFSAFPYRKYHTMLVVKRHITKFSELNSEEFTELKKILNKIEDYFLEKNIVGKKS